MSKPIQIAAFVLFMLLGFKTMIFHTFETDNFLEIILYISIWISGLYYFYINSASEQTWEDLKRDDKNKNFDSVLVFFQFLLFEGLWHALETKLLYYTMAIFALHLTYVIWDLKHIDEVKAKPAGRSIILFDFLGLLITILLVFSINFLPPNEMGDNKIIQHNAMWLSILASILVYHSIIGFSIAIMQFKHNPFKASKSKTHEPA